MEAKKLFEQLFRKASEFAIQENWVQAKSALQEILDHEKAHEISPEFKLKITVHLADFCVQLGLFNDARQMLENPVIVNLSESIEDISIKVSFYLVYGHTASELMGLEAADKNFEKALRLAESSNNLVQLESVLKSMLYIGRSFQNWNYLLERATLADEISSEKNLLELKFEATGSQAEAFSNLGRIDEAIFLAKKILKHNRESKNVDEYSKWNKFIEELKDKLPEKTLNDVFNADELEKNIGIITIDELPQAGDASTEDLNLKFEESLQEIDIPDAISNKNFIDADFSPNTISDQFNKSKSCSDKISSPKRKILPAKLISIPPIYGLLSHTESDNDYKTLFSYILECYYYEIYKKGTVTKYEKESLQNLFAVLHLNRDDATKALHKALEGLKDNKNEQTDYNTFFDKIETKMRQILSISESKVLAQKVAKAINYKKNFGK